MNRIRRAIAIAAIAVLGTLGLVAPASAAGTSMASCHHGFRSLGFLYEEQFVRQYKSGPNHYHVVRHLPPAAPIGTHTHTVKCGVYVAGKLLHY